MTGLASIAPRLAPLVRLLATDSDGEALAAARAIGRALRAAGCDWHDLADALAPPTVAPPTAPRPKAAPSDSLADMLDAVSLRPDLLDDYEYAFCVEMERRQKAFGRLRLTPKQAQFLVAIHARIAEADA